MKSKPRMAAYSSWGKGTRPADGGWYFRPIKGFTPSLFLRFGREKDMKVALQYCPTQGLAPLIEWLKQLQKTMHDPPLWSGANNNNNRAELDLVVTSGSQDGLCKVSPVAPSSGALKNRKDENWLMRSLGACHVVSVQILSSFPSFLLSRLFPLLGRSPSLDHIHVLVMLRPWR